MMPHSSCRLNDMYLPPFCFAGAWQYASGAAILQKQQHPFWWPGNHPPKVESKNDITNASFNHAGKEESAYLNVPDRVGARSSPRTAMRCHVTVVRHHIHWYAWCCRLQTATITVTVLFPPNSGSRKRWREWTTACLTSLEATHSANGWLNQRCISCCLYNLHKATNKQMLVVAIQQQQLDHSPLYLLYLSGRCVTCVVSDRDINTSSHVASGCFYAPAQGIWHS